MPTVQPEETRSERTSFDGKLVQVKTVTVELPNGRTTEREIVVHPDVIGVVPVLPDGRIVMVRQYRKAADRALLEIVAGGIDDGETPEQAAHREMEEETGYRIGSLQRISGFYTSPGYTTEYMHLFVGTDLQPGEPTEETDQIEVVQRDLSALLDRLTEDQELADAKTQLGLILYARSRGL